MKTTHRISLVAALALAATAAVAQGADRTQVQREFDEARRNGELIVSAETGLTERELYPHRYPARAVVGKTRDQVRAELAAAQRSGDVVANGETGLTHAQLNPARYGAPTAVAGKSRAEVVAELNEARRNGELFIGGEAGLTLREAYPQRHANAPARRDAASETVAQPSVPAPRTTTR
jgi:lambda repressor-like predicted transcriptional regulator